MVGSLINLYYPLLVGGCAKDSKQIEQVRSCSYDGVLKWIRITLIVPYAFLSINQDMHQFKSMESFLPTTIGGGSPFAVNCLQACLCRGHTTRTWACYRPKPLWCRAAARGHRWLLLQRSEGVIKKRGRAREMKIPRCDLCITNMDSYGNQYSTRIILQYVRTLDLLPMM